MKRWLTIISILLTGMILVGGIGAGLLYQRIHQQNLDNQSMFFGKKIVFYGDSIMWQGVDYWYPYLMQEFGFERVENLGSGGRPISGSAGSCQEEELAHISYEPDIIVIGGGTNDWARSVWLGDKDSTNTEEFYGALNTIFTKLTEKYPHTRLLLMLPPYSEYPDCPDFTDKEGIYNDRGLSVADYADVMRKVAVKYGIPVIDTIAEAGWNHYNLTEYVKFDGAYLHPNEEGMIRIGKLIVNALKDVEPIRLTKAWEGK